MAKVYISLGTNLGDKVQNLNVAIAALNSSCGIVEQTSSIYSSAPWGFESFNNFLNQVLLLETELSPHELIKNLLAIELSMGRNRSKNHYQDRIIDIDVLFYENLILKTENLEVPHPKLHERNFILQPMMELSPEFIHPLFNKSIVKLALASRDNIGAFKYEQ